MRDLRSRRVHEPFVFAALALGLTSGFGYAAFLAAALALKIPLDRWWGPTVQAHGHAQLFGWVGLLVIGVGLFFLPRLLGTRPVAGQNAPSALGWLAAGLVLRTLVQPALALSNSGSDVWWALRILWLASAFFELAGLFYLVRVMIATLQAAPKLLPGAPAYPVLPWVALASASLALALVSNAAGSIEAFLQRVPLLPPDWDALTILLLLDGLAIPMAIVFAVRNLPLYLRLAPPPRRELRPLAIVYALALAARLLPDVANIFSLTIPILISLAAIGAIVLWPCVFYIVWRLDLLHERPPWTTERAVASEKSDARPPTREQYPDYGEFGRFELLIYSGFVWLVVAGAIAIANNLAFLVSGNFPLPQDAERHAVALGFVTLLIFGMAVRMLPGFSGKRRVASPALVTATFVLGNVSAILRVGTLFFVTSPLALDLFGFSGAIGWLAVAALAINMWRTFQLPSREVER